MQEKQALGFFFSGHPFDAVKGEVSRFVRRNLSQLEPQKDFQLLAGLVTGVRTKITQRGKMAFIQLDDGSDMKEVSVFSETFDANRQRLKEDEVLVVEGKVQKDDFSGGLRIVAENIYTLAEARGRFARQLRLAMNGNGDARKLQNLIAPYVSPEGCPIRIAYTNPVASCELLLGEKARVRPDEELLKSLRDWLTPEAVDLQYQ